MFGGSLVTLVVAFGLLQWRIQDFPEEGAPTLGGGGGNMQFCQMFQKRNCMKLKEFGHGAGRGERVPHAPLDPPLFCPEILGNGGHLCLVLYYSMDAGSVVGIP